MIHSTNAACLVIFAIWSKFDIFSFSHMHKISSVSNDMTICREMTVSEVILQFIYTYLCKNRVRRQQAAENKRNY